MKHVVLIFTLAAAFAAFPAFVRAEPAKAEAYITNNAIEIDGHIIHNEYPVLNYENRTYTPVKVIAEALGASVRFDESTGRIIITSPEPTIIEVVKEVIVEVPVSEKSYTSIPTSQSKNKILVEVTEIIRSSSAAYAYLTVTNNNQFYALIKYKELYIEADGVKYYSSDNYTWANSINPSGGTMSGPVIFDPVPSDAKKITLVIPYTLQNKDTVYTFEFNIEL